MNKTEIINNYELKGLTVIPSIVDFNLLMNSLRQSKLD